MCDKTNFSTFTHPLKCNLDEFLFAVEFSAPIWNFFHRNARVQLDIEKNNSNWFDTKHKEICHKFSPPLLPHILLLCSLRDCEQIPKQMLTLLDFQLILTFLTHDYFQFRFGPYSGVSRWFFSSVIYADVIIEKLNFKRISMLIILLQQFLKTNCTEG
jgi:hypothetical protein